MVQSLFSEFLTLYTVSSISYLEHKYSGANPYKDV